MKQSVLHQCIARKTGESVQRIQRMGFRLLVVPITASFHEQNAHTPDSTSASVNSFSSHDRQVMPPA